jgi:hypothetical protein
MAQGKKSFILYCDLIHEVDHLTDEEKGKLFQHLLEYVNDMNPVLEDRVLLGSWKHIQRQLKRDLLKYEDIKEKRSEAGKASAEKRKQATTNPTSVGSVEQVPTNPTVNGIDTDTVNVNDTVTVNEIKEKKEALPPIKNNPLIDWIAKNAPTLNRMKQPLTNEQAETLMADLNIVTDANRQKLKNIMLNMENYKPLLSKSKSTNLTIRNWWKRDTENRNGVPDNETQPEREAREFMENLKAYNIHKNLYGEQSANEKFNFNEPLQPNLNNNRIA